MPAHPLGAAVGFLLMALLCVGGCSPRPRAPQAVEPGDPWSTLSGSLAGRSEVFLRCAQSAAECIVEAPCERWSLAPLSSGDEGFRLAFRREDAAGELERSRAYALRPGPLVHGTLELHCLEEVSCQDGLCGEGCGSDARLDSLALFVDSAACANAQARAACVDDVHCTADLVACMAPCRRYNHPRRPSEHDACDRRCRAVHCARTACDAISSCCRSDIRSM